jgi:hypothetical protein
LQVPDRVDADAEDDRDPPAPFADGQPGEAASETAVGAPDVTRPSSQLWVAYPGDALEAAKPRCCFAASASSAHGGRGRVGTWLPTHFWRPSGGTTARDGEEKKKKTKSSTARESVAGP